MKYLFGPVNSRRLGLSLGIDLIPDGICTQNCVYCEAGPKTKITCERREYSPTEEILAEIDLVTSQSRQSSPPDVYTITAKGEPTLHTGIGRVIRYLREKVDKPIVVLTNGTLLHLPEVREELMAADIVVPSLDGALPETYRRVNRSHRQAGLEELLTGLTLFTRDFAGQVWLEILLVRGMNDSEADIVAFEQAIARIRPTKVQLNTVVRPPLDPGALPLSRTELAGIAARLGGKVEIIAYPPERPVTGMVHPESVEILAMLARRPCSALDISQTLGITLDRATEMIHTLEGEDKIRHQMHDGTKYYTLTSETEKS